MTETGKRISFVCRWSSGWCRIISGWLLAEVGVVWLLVNFFGIVEGFWQHLSMFALFCLPILLAGWKRYAFTAFLALPLAAVQQESNDLTEFLIIGMILLPYPLAFAGARSSWSAKVWAVIAALFAVLLVSVVAFLIKPEGDAEKTLFLGIAVTVYWESMIVALLLVERRTLTEAPQRAEHDAARQLAASGLQRLLETPLPNRSLYLVGALTLAAGLFLSAAAIKQLFF